ncbi:four-helix bundle copper-binding protein [Streptomyces sp. AJS327]|uniref:four-helix bundle copper-binding protein n=1 Tax=Streptomyces sp. AJS327 TaxID=2545265 RepID=UPI0015DDF5A8|nr:four-helix bundle copper-binding protein [Streptomyces sp. AJS327]MBA0049429.1 four-helix bundle copper-binding protein [Streptomyces sp. AJS327]
MTTAVNDMVRTYPADLGGVNREKLTRCIQECLACSQACTACADACLAEPHVVELVKCVRTDLDCADICDVTGRVLSRHTGYDANITLSQLRACATACRSCADECELHGDRHEHCRICAEACRRCERACDELLLAMS